MDAYNLWLLIAGIACFGAAWIPHLVKGKPVSFPILWIGLGVVVFSLPLGLAEPYPLSYSKLSERLTELLVIIALMGVGLKLDRPLGWKSWNATWRLLGVTMLMCIALVALMGWAVLGLSLAGAILLGAVLAPTDPVLAADVQAAPPLEGPSSEIRFALTSESGLNDGLAFPFTNLAIALAATSGGTGWIWEWIWYDLLYKVAVGLLAGMIIGYSLAWIIFRVRVSKPLSQTGEGIAAVAITLISYSMTELVHGYGFLAVFVSALMIRHYESSHEYHKSLHEMAENAERLLMAIVLVLFGGALASGLLATLNWKIALVGLAFVFIVRPLAGLLGLLGSGIPRAERAVISFFGIRGIGSFYYLSHALNEMNFAEAELLWTIVAFVVLVSIVVHGIAVTPVMKRVEEQEG